MQVTLVLSLPGLFLSDTLGLIGLDVAMLCSNLCETDSLVAKLSKRETWALRCFLEDTQLDLLLTSFITAAVVGLDGSRGTALEQD